jgi:hypothetical protein
VVVENGNQKTVNDNMSDTNWNSYERKQSMKGSNVSNTASSGTPVSVRDALERTKNAQLIRLERR